MKKAGSVLLDTSIIVDYVRGDQSLLPHFGVAPAIYVPLVVLAAQLPPALSKPLNWLRRWPRISCQR